MAQRKTGDYFSISDILTAQEKVPCKIELPIYGLGYLDPSSSSPDLQPGTKMEMPFWMARSLVGRRRKILAVEPPKQYRESYREILNADASVVNLHKLGPHFYDFGSLLLDFQFPEAADIADILLQTFQIRFRRIMDSSQNALGESITALMEKLDEEEKRLFAAGQRALEDFLQWQRLQTHKLAESELVRRHRKRRRVGTDSQRS